MDLLRISILIFIPYMWIVAYLFMGPDYSVLDAMGLKVEDEHPAPYRLNGLKEGLLCVCFYMPAFYYNIYEMMYTTGLGRSTVPFWLTLIIVMFGSPWSVLQGGALDLPCGLFTLYAYFTHKDNLVKTFDDRLANSVNVEWTKALVQISGFIEGIYGLLLVFSPEHKIIDNKFVYDLQFSNADTRHLGLRSYGICTLVIGMFYIYWSIPSMQLQHMYYFVGIYHLLIATGMTILANNTLYPVPLSCMYFERIFHFVSGILILASFTMRPFKTLTIFQNGHLVPNQKKLNEITLDEFRESDSKQDTKKEKKKAKKKTAKKTEKKTEKKKRSKKKD